MLHSHPHFTMLYFSFYFYQNIACHLIVTCFLQNKYLMQIQSRAVTSAINTDTSAAQRLTHPDVCLPNSVREEQQQREFLAYFLFLWQ